MTLLVLLFLTGLVAAWAASEFQGRRWLRLLLGISTLLLVGGGSFLAASIGERFNYNAWYGEASGKLIDATVAGIEDGRGDEVVAELKRLRGQFQPTYENRAVYDRLVEEYADRMTAGKRVKGMKD
jgi:hypothetical protein